MASVRFGNWWSLSGYFIVLMFTVRVMVVLETQRLVKALALAACGVPSVGPYPTLGSQWFFDQLKSFSLHTQKFCVRT